MKTIGIVGGTGFVGKYITRILSDKGYNVIIFTRDVSRRNPAGNVSYAQWDAEKNTCDLNAIKKLDGAIHLAGAGIADKRWSEARKKEILDSRVRSTNLLVTSLQNHAPQCKAFVAASATGFYGPDDSIHTPFTEDARPATDFLGETCRIWEEASWQGAQFMRTAILRLGIVLGKESGAFAEFVKPMGFGIMPILGSGKQVVSWIEVEDLAKMFVFALEHEHVSGIYNAVAPHPLPHKALMQTIARVKGGLKIPAPVPAFVLQIMLGELSVEILKSCTVSAQKMLDAGFVFSYPELEGAARRIMA